MEFTLTAETREKTGSKACAALREDGKIPAVVYSEGKEAELISVPANEFESTWNKVGESTLIGLEGLGKEKIVLIQDVALDPIYDHPIHVDFYAVQTGKEVTVEVNLSFTGVAPAERDLGGVLIRVMRSIEITALPKDLPREIEVDSTSLETFEDQIQIKDLTLPEGVHATAEPEEVVALVQEPREEEPEEVTSEEEVDLSAIEIEKKGKAEEGADDDSGATEESTE